MMPMGVQNEHIIYDDVDPLFQLIAQRNFDSIFILCDEITKRYCYPFVASHIPWGHEVIVIPEGDSHKNLQSCHRIWNRLLEKNANRRSLLINLGGGMVGDMGAFCATVFMRGIEYVQIPTSLLAMVDASIGGKAGVNFDGFKNMIGTFSVPLAIFIRPDFLDTLDQRQIENGYVEMLKYGLIADHQLWQKLSASAELDPRGLRMYIPSCQQIKSKFVAEDPADRGVRKCLNFGHTIGHALERVAWSDGLDILHGEAVAFGMMVAAWLSHERLGLPENEVRSIHTTLKNFATEIPIDRHMEELLYNASKDKKNQLSQMNFVLLEMIGQPVIDVTCDVHLVRKAINKTMEIFA